MLNSLDCSPKTNCDDNNEQDHQKMTLAVPPLLEVHGSRLFSNWLAQIEASLVFTTYQAGKVFFIGLEPEGALSIFERTFDRCMGIAVKDRRIWMSTRNQIWRMEDFLDQGQSVDGYDANYVPITGHVTGDVDIHDVHIRSDGQPVFAVTRFNLIATLGDRGSFRALWKPPFIDKVAAEDRCHLNGFALEGDTLRYATCVGKSNVSDGWRDHRVGGGLLIDIPSNEIISNSLSMPHSPRLYQHKLWLIQSGTGEFGYIEPENGEFKSLCFIPGFGRGLTFIGNYAIIGMSLPRDNRSFNGLPLNERLAKEGATPKCGLCVINLTTGDLEHQLILDGVVKELFDVAVIPDVIRPRALGLKNDEINYTIKPETGEL
jgi:uncharacterized protein (TIGR03032 family)